MSDDKNVTLEQIKEQVGKIDTRLDALALGKANKVSPISISIPVSAWTDNTDAETLAEGFMFCADVAVEGLKEADSIDTTLAIPSLSSAQSCGMANTAKSRAGAVRYFAVEKPGRALTATLRVFQAKT